MEYKWATEYRMYEDMFRRAVQQNLRDEEERIGERRWMVLTKETQRQVLERLRRELEGNDDR